MNRFEIRYDDTVMKHYFYDTELKAQVKFQDVCDFINQQGQRIKALEMALALVCAEYREFLSENGEDYDLADKDLFLERAENKIKRKHDDE